MIYNNNTNRYLSRIYQLNKNIYIDQRIYQKNGVWMIIRHNNLIYKKPQEISEDEKRLELYYIIIIN
jgi:hypothetical protein